MRIDASGWMFVPALDQSGSQVSLGTAAKSWSLVYRVAKATGWKPGPAMNFRFSLPLHLSLKPGTRCSKGDLSWNPAFGEWVMGWPIGWSDPSSSVTGFAQWLRQSRSELSRLLMRDWHEAGQE
ncbi:hypothetical protein J2X65_002056 [Ancylobacter sp. 3268]|uniref:hypothetical protein n=1 Tax=Ancylobacter sp. 3268 TaxID=2817752 RepID=UPI00286258D6|nr:hypothetical protein [Ancylobacter sp. 3268]MDR6952697.1 hypothetical protein [Ancylobacter sp. 3268]